jgi:hypothetical protein
MMAPGTARDSEAVQKPRGDSTSTSEYGYLTARRSITKINVSFGPIAGGEPVGP